jgi:hypothetical protein
MRVIERIILHRSQSHWGSDESIKEWHTNPKELDDGTFRYLTKVYATEAELPAHVRSKRGNGWSKPGYHHVVLNMYPTYSAYNDRKPIILADGKITQPIPYETAGIHTAGYNATSIAICLIGLTTFTSQQLFSVRELVQNIRKQFGEDLPLIGHDELIPPDSKKICPHLDMDYIREFVQFPIRRIPSPTEQL